MAWSCVFSWVDDCVYILVVYISNYHSPSMSLQRQVGKWCIVFFFFFAWCLKIWSIFLGLICIFEVALCSNENWNSFLWINWLEKQPVPAGTMCNSVQSCIVTVYNKITIPSIVLIYELHHCVALTACCTARPSISRHFTLGPHIFSQARFAVSSSGLRPHTHTLPFRMWSTDKPKQMWAVAQIMSSWDVLLLSPLHIRLMVHLK